MNLFPFFNKKEKTGVGSTLDSSSLMDDVVESHKDKESIKPSLYLPSEWKFEKEQEYVLRFLSNELPPLKPSQISLDGISINTSSKRKVWNIEAFVRSSINQSINLGTTELLLLDKKENIVASHEFDLSKIGEIPANSNVPWVFEFPEHSITVDEIPSDGWKLAFDLTALQAHSLDLDNEWKEKLSVDDQKKLADLVDSLPPLKKNQVNITGFQSNFTQEGGLAISLFISNGSKKNIQLIKFPLEVRDASDSVVAKGVFDLKDFIVKRNTSKPWTFIFPKENLLDPQPDMSNWKASLIQK
ncbi:accessory Sec system S-layer assembly protein [Planococcus beigongshangi]|uniref:accessory Sec system S-layer assembly protein n=1 Tax=Planococcus beigongshangi TaxID=2782536 RepID=UPI00193C2CA6|nr:accessory Sec system S-layer assembly protein [Planococcus beigongshangi]